MGNKPRIRFKGFNDDWEQYKLSDITEVIMGQSPSSKNYTDNPNDDILVQGNADLKDGKVVPRLWTKEITKTIDKGGIILTVRAPVGDVAKTDYKVVLGRGVAGIKGNDYIYQFLQKLQYNRYWVSLSSGSTFESINSNDIKDLIIDIPSIEEQTKISMLLNNVNSIITLHQCKLEKLKLTKKALLQKLFPKNGKHIPEIRFKGFTDAWEQCKFGELFEYERPDAYIVKSDNYNDVFNMPVLTANKAFILGYTNEENSYNKPSIIFDDFTLDKKYVDFPYMLKSSAIKILTSKNQHNLRFLFERLNSTRFEVLGHARHYISIVQNTSTLCPSIEEEFCISNLLTRFDEIITLHQRKLERLQEVKKGLLQKMFV